MYVHVYVRVASGCSGQRTDFKYQLCIDFIPLYYLGDFIIFS